MSDRLVGGADDLAAYFGMDTPEGRFQHDLAREIERLEAIVDKIPPDRLNPWHTVTVKADGWHMAHPIDCVLAECAFDGLAQAEWVEAPTAPGVWQWHEFEDEPGDWSEGKTNE